MKREILRKSEEAQHIAEIKASRKPRSKHSPEWTNLKKVKNKAKESKASLVPLNQMTLDEADAKS